jgi:4'-phosphopantetheinyl transferase
VSFHPSPFTFQLERFDVHVWRVVLDQPAIRLQSLWEQLAPEERDRAARFHFPKDRDRFVAARGLLRVILGAYLGVDPAGLRFTKNAYGKPALAEQRGPDDLRFNLSHSHELVLYAITRGREVGIDVEWMRPDLADEEIAARFFSPREVAALRALPEPQRLEAFFNCWTRKEAFIKARGEGLSLPLDEFDVSLAPGEPAALLGTCWDPHEAGRWSLRALSPGPGYAAALAVEGECDDPMVRPWPLS